MSTTLSRVCKRCNIARPIEKFRVITKVMAKGNINKYPQHICTPCIVESNKHYQKDKKEHLALGARARRNARKLRAIEYLGGVCDHCKQVVHTAAFDFHHRDPSQKERDPGLMMGLSDSKLFKELDKCVLLCSNCHRAHHFNEWYNTEGGIYQTKELEIQKWL